MKNAAFLTFLFTVGNGDILLCTRISAKLFEKSANVFAIYDCEKEKRFYIVSFLSFINGENW